ncbi:hypothetical protein LEP1GSC035_0391 [Leptospira noguchii str. 2007001578]|uniref:Uncharacterized protein n=1 Tax=Leptospira noguchii str. 2007001578 TaxID=1049974 RepID=A0ABP2T2G2_9LEPT|nr:hypothetical protein LEP1GSC035_0391 [Leptospira noguchii str. 2007001578]
MITKNLKFENGKNVNKFLVSYLDRMIELIRLTQRKINSIAKYKTF